MTKNIVRFQNGQSISVDAKDWCLQHQPNNQGFRFLKGVDKAGVTGTWILLLLFTNPEHEKAEGQNSGRK